jgi:hypothetical protein
MVVGGHPPLDLETNVVDRRFRVLCYRCHLFPLRFLFLYFLSHFLHLRFLFLSLFLLSLFCTSSWYQNVGVWRCHYGVQSRCLGLSLWCGGLVSGAVAAVRGVSVRRGLCLCATYEESGGDDIVKP